jgi:hypothetical protein
MFIWVSFGKCFFFEIGNKFEGMCHHKFESVHNFEVAITVTYKVVMKVFATRSFGGFIA